MSESSPEVSSRMRAANLTAKSDEDARNRGTRHRHTERRHHRTEHYESEDSDREHSRRHRRNRDHGAEESDRRQRNYRERSASRDRSLHRRHRSRSPPAKRRRRSDSVSRSPAPTHRSRAPLPSQDDSFRGSGADVAPADGNAAPVVKQKPNYKPTGLLAKEANTVAGTTTVLKYHEPPEARKPPSKEPWRIYVFKDKDLLDTIYIYSRSAWLFGRDEKVTDYLLDHPSASKQHAVIQFRHRTSANEFGDKTSKVKPYLIDLESANGTKLNGKKIEVSRYVELVDGDVIGFGDSEKEYVMMLPPANT